MEQVFDIIDKSNFFKKFCLKNAWLSGGSTYVYPIEHWIEEKRIDFQIDSLVNHNGMTNSFKSLIKELKKYINITDWFYVKNDGSCPQEYTIFYE